MTSRITRSFFSSIMVFLLVASPAAESDLRLVAAVKRQDEKTVRALLQQRVDVNASEGDGATALQWAAYRDDAEIVDLLIRAGANVNAANDLGVTPLALACANGNAAVVAKLLAFKADPDRASPSGVTPLMIAARVGSVAVVNALLAAGANVNAVETSRGQTALMWAVAQRHSDVVRVLIDRGADVHARSRVSLLRVNRGGPNGTDADTSHVGEVEKGGSTALLFAARQGDLESAKLLIAARADVNTTAPDGYSALLLASHSGHGAVASLLLKHGADPNAAGAGFTALHTAVLTADLELVKALLAHGADPNARLTKGTPIRRNGEDLALPSVLAGATPFFLAAKFADIDTLKVLLAAGADPRVPLKDETTPLMAAAGLDWGGATNRRGVDIVANKAAASDPYEDEIRTLEVVRLMVDLGADVNAVNQDGDTALFGAVPRGFKTVVQFLADRGARLDVKNKRGQSLLSLASPRDVTSGTPPAMLKATETLLRELSAKG
jgi:ankyrin repeat protein